MLIEMICQPPAAKIAKMTMPFRQESQKSDAISAKIAVFSFMQTAWYNVFMSEHRIKYGKTELTLDIPDKNLVGVFRENIPYDTSMPEADLLAEALAHPVSSPRLRDIVSEGEKVAVITSDITRPTPSSIMLPPVIKELRQGGVREADIMIVLALGTHRNHTEQERETIVGPALYRSDVQIIDSDRNDCERLGHTGRGTPVDVFRPVADADRIVCLGNIEFHYYAGYSGGCKAVFPGVSSVAAIRENHRHMMDPGAGEGLIDGNPVREDIDEAGLIAGIDFILNVIIDENGRVISAVSGDCIRAHRQGCLILDRYRKMIIDRPADIAVISPGGFPKDLNLYQAHKALESTKSAVRPGGVIIWCAQAGEGIGNANFADWLLNLTFEEMSSKIKNDFVLGGHLAYFIAEILQTKKIFLVSDIREDVCTKQGISRFSTVQEAFDEAIRICGGDARTILVPAANSVCLVSGETL